MPTADVSGPTYTTTFAAAFEAHSSRDCASVKVSPSAPLARQIELGDAPLRLDGLIAPDWSAEKLPALLNEEEQVQVQLSWHAAADARPSSNGTIVSPAARWLSLREGMRLLRSGSAVRGYPAAYLRQSDLGQQPGLRSFAPVARALEHAGSRLHKAGMWLGDSSMISTLHHDEYHNILLLLAGRKRVIRATAQCTDPRAFCARRAPRTPLHHGHRCTTDTAALLRVLQARAAAAARGGAAARPARV